MERLAIFDYHGTLIWAKDLHDAAFSETVMEVYGVKGYRFDLSFAASTDQDVVMAIARKNDVPEDVISANEGRILPAYEKHFCSCIGEASIKILPGVRELLEGLAEKNILLALATGESEVTIDAVFERTGLGAYFGKDVRACASRKEPVRDRRELVREAIARAEKKYRTVFPKERTYLFDDSSKGIQAGKSLRIVTIGIGTGPEGYDTMAKNGPSHAFKDLSDYRRVLEIVFG